MGSTRVVFDGNGGIHSYSSYEPFGKAVDGVGSNDRLSFIGKEKDSESDLGDFGARKYDEETGRFLSTDPLWEKYRGLHLYQYSANNPIIFKDVNGKEIDWVGTPEQQESMQGVFLSNMMDFYDHGAYEAFDLMFEAYTSKDFLIRVAYTDEWPTGEDGQVNIFSYAHADLTPNAQTGRPSDGTIFWNPNLGVNVENGSIGSGGSLLHELAHAMLFIKNPGLFHKLSRTVNGRYYKSYENKPPGFMDPYTDGEEKRVITGIEERTAQQMGWKSDPNKPLRTSHTGAFCNDETIPTSNGGGGVQRTGK